MFDISEYYTNSRGSLSASDDTAGIEENISADIDELLKNRFQKLYLTDRYKYAMSSIEIVYPALDYPGKRPFFLTPDKLRFYLSSYPAKEELRVLKRIVIRPRYIEINDVELAALYLRESQILVLYMTDPSYMNNTALQTEGFVSVDLPKLSKLNLHPIWHYISVIAQQTKNTGIEKFFVRKDRTNGLTAQDLVDMSYFYSRHGY